MLKNTRRLLFFSASIWRHAFIFHTKPYFKEGEKFIYSRSSIIPHIFIGVNLYIHSGKKWRHRNVTHWRVGFKFGEFTWNRRIAVYKAKQLRKKKLKEAAKKKKQR